MTFLSTKVRLLTAPRKRAMKGQDRHSITVQASIDDSGDMPILIGLVAYSDSIKKALTKYDVNDVISVAGEMTLKEFLKSGERRSVLQLTVESVLGVKDKKAIQTKLKSPNSRKLKPEFESSYSFQSPGENGASE